MRVKFTKMHGAGNDFVVFDGVHQSLRFTPERVRRIADRHFGIGCDQVLVVEPPTGSGADFRYRIYNADGSEVEQCGNGARCFAQFVRDRGLTDKTEIEVETLGGRIRPRIESNGEVVVDLGVPRFEPAEIPFTAAARALDYDIDMDGERVRIGAVALGNPHAVLRVDDVERAPVAVLGPAIERHPRFPRGANVSFMQIIDRTHARLRVYERGAGETLACGSGACAATIMGRLWGRLDESVDVALPGGTLRVAWAGAGQPVWLAGPAVTVYEGTIDLDHL